MMLLDLSALAWAYYCSEWAVRLVMVVVIPFRRTSDAARSWLLLVMFLPWPALVLYLLIGRATYPRWRRRRFAQLPRILQISADRILHLTDVARERPPRRFARAAVLIEKIGRLPVVDGASAELLADYVLIIDRLIGDIDAATRHVHLLFYIFADDETGGRVMEALGRARRRGVACRVLIDAVGSRPWAGRVLARLKDYDVEAYRILPITLFRRKSARADLRNHRKIAVIDGVVAYAGSQNIISPETIPNVNNQELMLRLEGPVVLELQAVFIADWFLETEEALPVDSVMAPTAAAGTVATQVLPSGPDYRVGGIESLLVTVIHSALQQVVLVTPYFVPSEAVLKAMQIAVLRGVQVHLVVPKIADHHLVRFAQQSYYDELLAVGASIHLFRDAFLHAKNVSIDTDVALIGSSNMDMRSFVLNSEVTVVIYDRTVTLQLRAMQEGYMASSDLLILDEWRRRPLTTKVAENLARLVSPLL
ncbi:cardiolipin synthase [Labrys monachus]|uniref:Cardiolipin synthase n=1 Tax=Labrys monachus TaxID=217067 RepID=A0ABU0FHC2_9HYPH|nr:cardiolipin synthase [Labrys monachus]MDQ0393921.1 cardiolipin synthase [Labrys monachus]